MITILTTTNYINPITEAVKTVDRLHELVAVVTETDSIETASKLLIVDNDTIGLGIDWFDTEPPYIIPNVVYSSENLLALVFYKLGNHQKAFEFISEENTLFPHLLIATQLQFGYEISEELYSKATLPHNKCVIQHYGNIASSCSEEALKTMYETAIEIAENEEIKLYTAKHYSNLLIDGNAFQEAEILLRSLKRKAISEEAIHTLYIQLAYALMGQLKVPYKADVLEEISELFKNGIAYYESQGLNVNAGLLYVDASEIANFQNDYIASKDLINKAILYFKEENISEFLGEAGLRKATLLYTWSKNGSPQYYKAAINAFQDTLKVFKRDTHPQKFAEIHHNLALIYSEIPVSSEEKPIWTAFCASSFKEVLKFYTKEEYPYEHAMASHNYATALMSFPEAKLHNNLEKAYSMFEDALAIRTASLYPFERAITLINQLELYWFMHNENTKEESENYSKMVSKANEIKELVTDKSLVEKANEHLEALHNLKTILN